MKKAAKNIQTPEEDLSKVWDKVKTWLNGNFDKATVRELKELIIRDKKGVVDAFYKDMEFGTAGLRGIMGVGTNRMNQYTVARTTQGLVNYLKKQSNKEIKIAIAFDSRHNSKLFARTTAEICAANGCKVYLFDSLKPVPELSFAIRYLDCNAGVMITASHNRKEYNGYKVYWKGGAQIIAPHDRNIMVEIKKIKGYDLVGEKKFDKNIQEIGGKIDKAYLARIKALVLSTTNENKNHPLKIVYTPLHGTGFQLVPKALQSLGFKNVYIVAEQGRPDGDFPTVISPNPEEPSAMKLALNMGRKIGASLILGTDPDCDRVGIGVKNSNHKYQLLTGNQTGSLLAYYLLTQYKKQGKLTGKEYLVKSIVTTDLIEKIATDFGVECINVLTGFKYIAETIKNNETHKHFILGAEESYGYLVGDFVRDKDAVIASAIISEMTVWSQQQGKSLFDLLIEVYLKYGFFKEKLVSIVKDGKEGLEKINDTMVAYRSNAPKEIAGKKVIKIIDYQSKELLDLEKNETTATRLPSSNVLQFFLENGSKISIRPSGTEPKLKYYISVKLDLSSKEQYLKTEQKADANIREILNALSIPFDY